MATSSTTKRVLVVVAVALAAALAGALLLRPERGVPEGAPTEAEMAAEVGTPVMQHVYRGHLPGRSGEVVLVPKPHHFLISDWDLTSLGTDRPFLGSTHPNPWDYLTRVPIIFYGAGVRKGAVVDEPIDIANLAPTYARLLGIDLDAEAEPLEGAVDYTAKPPKVIFNVVIDGGGWNALQEHPGSTPTIDALRRQGTTYVNATIGSAPSVTGALHATFGTGSYPRTHGMPGHVVRNEQGELVDVYLDNADPRYLALPTVSELWDERNGNKPVVATVAFEGWHLGMIGHGAQRQGGDKDVAVLWERDEEHWWTNEDYYTLPSYLQTTDMAKLESYERALDGRDGLADGAWFGHRLEELQERTIRPGTPAFVRFTGDAVIEVLRRERVGRDDITDLVWIEMKMPDYAGHAWNVVRPEQADVLRETDRQIARMKRLLDTNVGRRSYLLMISADHGQQPLPDIFGGWRINTGEVREDLEERFGRVIQQVTPSEVFLQPRALEEGNVEAADIARYLATYTVQDSIPEDRRGLARVPQARLDDRVFAGAFSTGFLAGLTPARIESFGDGIYPEGDFTVSVKTPG